MLLTELGDDILCHIAKAMVSPTSVSTSKIQERHFHDVWNFSRVNRYVHDLLWPESEGYWQQMVAVHGSSRLFSTMPWRKVALKLMREEKVAHSMRYCPRVQAPGYLTQPPEWAIRAIGSQKPASPSFWDRPVITKATEWNIQMNPINDPKRKVLPDYRLLSMPCLTSVEVIVCREVPEGPLARSMRDTMVVDHFTARNPDGLMIGDIAKAFAVWLPTSKSAAMVQLRKEVGGDLTRISLCEPQSTALLRTWPFNTINGGRTLAILHVRRPRPSRYHPNQQIIDEVNNAFGEEDAMDYEAELEAQHQQEEEEDEDEEMGEEY